MTGFFGAGVIVGVIVSMNACAADSTATGSRPPTGRAGTSAVSPEKLRSEDKIALEFAEFAGSQDNARSLVTGLRQGTEITLAAAGEPVSMNTTFTPPTPPMDNANTRIALALAQEQLIRLGITQPTAEQIKAALAGGTVSSRTASTRLPGVLYLRAQGAGWDSIAHAMGTKLGHVMSGLKQTHQQIAAGRPVPGAGAADAARVTTAAGTGKAPAGTN